MYNVSTKRLTCANICTSLNLEYDIYGKPKYLKDISLSDLEEKRKQLKTQAKQINNEINVLLNTHYILKYKDNQEKEKEKQKRLAILSDEEFCINVIDRFLYDEIIRRKRPDMSTKALNHGGVYTSATMSKPRVGMGFKGYGGICL